MGRLTEYHNGVAVIRDKSKHKEAMERLAFYEDLEETLENTLQGYVTIKDFILMNAEWFKMMNTEPELADAMMITNEEVKKYKEWKDLEEQNLLLKLPCMTGDIIYDISSLHILSYKVESFKIIRNRVVSMRTSYIINDTLLFSRSYVDDIGKTVFLTKSEAEKALAEMEK